MMPDQPLDIRGWSFTAGDRLFLDTNVWLSVYGPDPTRRWRSDVYQHAFRQMREARSKVHVDVLVLSEFINAWSRMEYNQAFPNRLAGGFKAFRDSPAFEPIAQEIAISATRICNACERCESGFELVDIGSLLVEYG